MKSCIPAVLHHCMHLFCYKDCKLIYNAALLYFSALLTKYVCLGQNMLHIHFQFSSGFWGF